MAVGFDPDQNTANIAKHGVFLAEGDGVLLDPLGLTVEDESAEASDVGSPSARTRSES